MPAAFINLDNVMSTVKEIASAISKLAPTEVHAVADWLQA